MTKRILTALLALVLLAGLCPGAMAVHIDDSEVFIKQSPSTCTLASATMLLRRKAVLDGDANWASITEGAVRKVAWTSGLAWNFSYNGVHITVARKGTWAGSSVESKKQALIELLAAHPEGVVAYDRSYPHAVLLTHYDAETGIFYCSDPVKSRPQGIIPLSQASTNGSGQDGKLARIDQLWYSDYGVSNGAGTMPVPETAAEAPAVEEASQEDPNLGLACEQLVEVDGVTYQLPVYILKDEQGNEVNYIRVRDLAQSLDGSAAQFDVGFDSEVLVSTDTPYSYNGTEINTHTPEGRIPYTAAAATAKVDGVDAAISSVQLKDDQGGGHTYYNLRDLGAAVGFQVSWDAQAGICIHTGDSLA